MRKRSDELPLLSLFRSVSAVSADRHELRSPSHVECGVSAVRRERRLPQWSGTISIIWLRAVGLVLSLCEPSGERRSPSAKWRSLSLGRSVSAVSAFRHEQ